MMAAKNKRAKHTLHGSDVRALDVVFELGNLLLQIVEGDLLILNHEGDLELLNTYQYRRMSDSHLGNLAAAKHAP
jgi:hypothetical protein